VALIAGLAASVAIGGLLYQSGFRPPWLRRLHLDWMASSDDFAARAYQTMLRGDRPGALVLFEQAVLRDPASPYRWCDYGEALLTAGRRGQAERCIRRGVELGPYTAPILMRAVNFAYRTGDGSGMLEHGRRLLGITEAYDAAVFSVWDRAERPAGGVPAKGIPDRRAAQSYLRHLTSDPGGAAKAQTVWAWIRGNGFADDRLADDYAGYLLRCGQAAAAARDWQSYVRGREAGYPELNAVFNGGFERPPAGTVFDWRIDAAEGARADRAAGGDASGRYNLRIVFDGTQNIAYGHVAQTVVLEPGAWHFSARMRTEGLTTDQGLGFRIFDIESPQRLEVRTERLSGTHDWTTLAAHFRIDSAPRPVRIQIARDPSLKFDNRIAGEAWVDAVALHR
jgi:hypothetical protein